MQAAMSALRPSWQVAIAPTSTICFGGTSSRPPTFARDVKRGLHAPNAPLHPRMIARWVVEETHQRSLQVEHGRVAQSALDHDLRGTTQVIVWMHETRRLHGICCDEQSRGVTLTGKAVNGGQGDQPDHLLAAIVHDGKNVLPIAVGGGSMRLVEGRAADEGDVAGGWFVGLSTKVSVSACIGITASRCAGDWRCVGTCAGYR